MGCEKDAQRAFSWYQKSAAQGFSAAQSELGNCYFYGEG